jgi:hypothetical protein
MKKIFALLLALTMVVGAVSAQATVNGYVRSIATYDNTKDTFTLANRLRLSLGWKSEDGNVEFGARIQNSDWTSANTFLVANYAYGQIKLADGKVVVSGGRLWNFDYDISSTGSDYASTGNVANGAVNNFYNSTSGADGMLFQVLPIEGLNIGLLVLPDSDDLGFSEFGFGAKYSIKKIGDLVLTGVGAADIEKSSFSATFNLTAIDNLTAAVGYKGLDVASIIGLFTYTADALYLEVAPEYNVTNSQLYIEGLAKYTVGDFALAALAGYDESTDLLSNTCWASVEAYYTVGKGQLVLAPSYGDATGFATSLVVKVNF